MHPLVADYQTSLEEALTRLLGAEEYFQSPDETGNGGPHQEDEDEEDLLLQQDVETVKSLFHAHEQLMNELTEYEGKITEILNEGKVLLDSSYCSHEEKKAIECQRSLLAARWERLQQRSSVRQSRLHEALMLLQHKQIGNLRAWLISAEDRISNFMDVGPDLRSVHRQLQDYKVRVCSEFCSITSFAFVHLLSPLSLPRPRQALQQEVAQQQDTVNSLSNVVVIIDGADYDSENMSNDLEDQLNALSEKWAHVCRFIEDRGRTLDIVSRNWQMLEDEEIKFNQWIIELERRLSEMEESAAELEAGSPRVTESIQHLQQLEQEVEQQHVHYSMIVEEGQKLLDHLDKPSQSFNEVNGKLERLTDVWDLAVQRMENLGLALTRAASAPAPRAQKHDLPSHSSGHAHGNSVSTSAAGAKKIRLDSCHVKEWQRDLENISTWLGRIEDDLGLDDEENGAVVWEELAVEEQQILLEDTETAVEEKRNIVDSLIGQGKTIITGLKSYGENVKKLEDIVEAVDERWALVKEELDRKKIKIRTTSELVRINSEADAMKRALHSHQKWLQSAELSLENVRDLEKIEEQSRVRTRSMQMQKKKVDKMREEIEDILDDLPQLGDDESLRDIKYFIGFWETINDRNNQLQKKIRTKSRDMKRQSMKAAGIEMPLHLTAKISDEGHADGGDLSPKEDHAGDQFMKNDSVHSDSTARPVIDVDLKSNPSSTSSTARSYDEPDIGPDPASSSMDDHRSSSGDRAENREADEAKAEFKETVKESKWSEKYPREAVSYDRSDETAAGRKAARPSSLDTRTKPAVPPKTYKSPQQEDRVFNVQTPKSTPTPTSPIYDSVPVSPTSPSASAVRHVTSPPPHVSMTEDRLNEILLEANERREEIAVVVRQLNNSKELNGKDYESFGKQEPALKCVKESAIDNLKPRIEKLMVERTGFASCLDPGHQVNRVLEKMWSEWLSLRELFMKRHRRWWRAREVLQQFEAALTDVNSWLDSAEKSLATSRLPSGELNMQLAHQLQESLRIQFSQHIPIYGIVCVLSRRVISQCASGYGSLLQEQLQTVDQRWAAAVRELAWRRERLEADGRNLDIMGRWTELTGWLEKVKAALEKAGGNIPAIDVARKSLMEFKVRHCG